MIIYMVFANGLNYYNSNSAKNFINVLSYTFLLSLGESLMIIPELILKKKISSNNIESNNNNINENKSKDINSKIIGTNNPRNVVYATMNALENMQTAESVAKKRGKKVSEIL